LINTLVNRKHLVKTSSTPGRTQLINFFIINEAFSFVDLPGFGYAKVPAAIRKSWGPMIETYLSTRKTLKGVVLIMDIRRIPGMQELNFIEWLRYYTIPGILVLTKSDKLSKNKQITQRKAIADALGVPKEEPIPFSAKSRMGKDDLWDALERLIDFQGVT
jgi:GTP-binding protein